MAHRASRNLCNSRVLWVLALLLTTLAIRPVLAYAEEDIADAARDDASEATIDTTRMEELELLGLDDGSGAVTVRNLHLYDLDGTEQTLSGDYDCMKRCVIVGRYGCSNTRNVVDQALVAAEEDEFADISFLVLDVDGNKSVFQEGFGSWETDRVRFFSSGSTAYDSWAWWAYWAVGNEECSVALPFTVLIDKSNHVQAVLTGVQDVRSLCRTYLSGNESNPDDVDPGDPDQFEPEVPDDPSAYDELSFSVWGNADMQSGRELLPLVNQARAAVGVSALRWDSELEETAYQRGAELMVAYGHVRPNGYKCYTAWPASHANYHRGENIAEGFVDAVSANTGWSNSSGHYANMISSEYSTFGAAHFKAEDGTDFWVECFSGGAGTGMTDSPIMGKVNVGIDAIKGNVHLSLEASPGTYNENLDEFDRSIPKLKINQKQQLVLTSYHADIDPSDVIWTSSNPSVIRIDDTGKVLGVAAGSANITAALASYPELSVTETVTVGNEQYEGLVGMWGTCPWEIDDEGTLLIYPGTGQDSEAYVNLPVSYWIEHTGEIRSVRCVEQGGKKVVAPEDCQFLFGRLTNLTTADLTGLDTSHTTQMHGLFAGCSSLQSVDVTGLDLSQCVDIARFFKDCTRLKSVDLSGWDVSHVSQMYYVFQGCSALEQIYVGGWDTSAATDMDGMFKDCTRLKSLDLSSWDTSSLDWNNFTYPMFDGCMSLAELRVGKGFAVNDERGFPDATASNGKWWSAATREWLTKSEIVNGHLGSFNLYSNYENTSYQPPKSLSDASVKAIADQAYSGNAQTPELTVTCAGTTLVKDRDYTLHYTNNVSIGTATATITGMGDYMGTKTVQFKIVAASITGATVTGLGSHAYTGSAITPTVTVKLNGRTLVLGTDYTVRYANNINVGMARVTITGKGNYKGTLVTSGFEIVAANIACATIAPIASQAYTGFPVTPEPTVTMDGRTLVSGTDYTVRYLNNVEVGTASLTVTGKGNYAGTKSATFEVYDKPFFLDATPGDERNHGTEVDWMGRSGISAGWEVAGGREFRGMRDVKRCDFAAFLYRMYDLSDDGERNDSCALEDWEVEDVLDGVSDCTARTSHAAEVAWMIDSGISRGWGNADGTVSFRPMAQVARQDMAAFLYRFADLQDDAEQNQSLKMGPERVAFSDVKHGDVTNHAPEVEWLASVGVTKGWGPMADGTFEFRGRNNVKRQDMAAFLYRLNDYLN